MTTQISGGNGTTAGADVPEVALPAPRPSADPAPPVPTKALGNLTHGGQVISGAVFDDTPDAGGRADLSPEDAVLGHAVKGRVGTPFGYLFPDLAERWPADHLPVSRPGEVVGALKALGSAMVEGDIEPPENSDPRPDTPVARTSTVPPIFTYWGQFIDHDITANTDRDNDLSIVERDLKPEDPRYVAERLRNLRQPALNLDSLYGDGPGMPGDDPVPYDGNRFLLGKLSDANPGPDPNQPPTAPIPPADTPEAVDQTRDLPRHESGKARIGDGRNDENLVIAQLHTAFLHAHNHIVDLVEPQTPNATQVFEEARRLLRWTYQWLVRHQFLTKLVPAEAIAAVEGNPRFSPSTRGVYMPLEFSVAAYRFGHSMVRARYDWNSNFGRPSTGRFALATFDQLFQFTGSGGFIGGAKTLPDNWPAEWDRFVDGPTAAEPDRGARLIDTHVAFPLDELRNEGNDTNSSSRVNEILKRLAVRNLLRGYKLAIPTGQAVARAYGVTPLTSDQLLSDTNRQVRHALHDGGLLDATPLWFYVLKEAELSGGDQLGAVGGRIVAETLIGQLRHDPESYLAVDETWSPAQQGNPAGRTTLRDIGGPDITSIADLLRFAGVLA